MLCSTVAYAQSGYALEVLDSIDSAWKSNRKLLEEQLPSSSGRIDFIAVKSKYLSSNDYFAVVNQWYNTNEGGDNGGFTSQRPAFLKAVRRVITRVMAIYVLLTVDSCNSLEELQYALRTKFRRVNRKVVEKLMEVLPEATEIHGEKGLGQKLYYSSYYALREPVRLLVRTGELHVSLEDYEEALYYAVREAQAKDYLAWVRDVMK